MRDYNNIQFRSPKQNKVTEHPLVSPPTDSPRGKGSTSTAASSTTPLERPPSPFRSASPVVKGNSPLSAADALAMRRDGPEQTIQRLRDQLTTASEQQASQKAAQAKSDAVILELRSSVRQLKRQMEKLTEEKAAAEQAAADAEARFPGSPRSVQDEESIQSARDARVGELQVQLDRAHAQILTADMVRKELEDTLEAEQYTWELRVQDQERTIQELQHTAKTLSDDLEQCRSQWKEAEEGWTEEVQELQTLLEKAQQEAKHWKSMQKDSAETSQLKERLLTMEQERAELQGCLDEALKELEAVDAELQNDESITLRQENELLQRQLAERDGPVVEQLQHLYRWLLERDGDSEHAHALPGSHPSDVISAIRSHLEQTPPVAENGNNKSRDFSTTQKQIQELESQLSVYRGDLKAREESSAELRASLKEAVALLKPLQDAVAKADKEKAKLQDQLNRSQESIDSNLLEMKKLKETVHTKEDEMEKLKEEVEMLELQLSRAKLAAASTVLSQNKLAEPVTPEVSKAREKLRAKRESEMSIKQVLHDAQTRFHTLHQQNQEIEALNSELEGRLRQAEEGMEILPSEELDDKLQNLEELQRTLESNQAKTRELEKEASALRKSIAVRDEEVQKLQKDLDGAKSALQDVERRGDAETLQRAEERVRKLEADLASKEEQLLAKKEAEKALNRSLKDALGLLKPLQMHLEDAENEKKEIAKELQDLKRQLAGDGSRSTVGARSVDADAVRDLEITVRQLEKENSQLHDALENMSQSLNASHLSGGAGVKNDARLREELVELKSRYEVTQGRLEDAFVENHTLVEALQKREREEKELSNEVKTLREKLKITQVELENAKFIATSALVKVEELTMKHVELGSGLDHDSLYKEKAKQLDQEMKGAGQRYRN